MPKDATALTAPGEATIARALTVLLAPGDPTGYPISHPYIENLYLPMIGPSTYVLLRLLDRLAEQHTDAFSVTLDYLAHRIGLGNNGTSNRTTHTIDRLCAYRLAVRIKPDTVVLPRRLPALSNRQLDRLAPEIARLDQHYRLSCGPR